MNQVKLEEGRGLLMARDNARDLAAAEGVEMEQPDERSSVTLVMLVKGKRPISDLITRLSGIEGVREIGTVDGDYALD